MMDGVLIFQTDDHSRLSFTQNVSCQLRGSQVQSAKAVADALNTTRYWTLRIAQRIYCTFDLYLNLGSRLGA